MKYTLSGEGVGSIFTIEPSTGDIHALRSLDREEKAYYTLRAQAVDVFTEKALEPESTFIIKVQDINDNEPKFLEGPYVASVPEMSPVGKLQITAWQICLPKFIRNTFFLYFFVPYTNLHFREQKGLCLQVINPHFVDG